jgi:hypothetical protein
MRACARRYFSHFERFNQLLSRLFNALVCMYVCMYRDYVQLTGIVVSFKADFSIGGYHLSAIRFCLSFTATVSDRKSAFLIQVWKCHSEPKVRKSEVGNSSCNRQTLWHGIREILATKKKTLWHGIREILATKKKHCDTVVCFFSN